MFCVPIRTQFGKQSFVQKLGHFAIGIFRPPPPPSTHHYYKYKFVDFDSLIFFDYSLVSSISGKLLCIVLHNYVLTFLECGCEHR